MAWYEIPLDCTPDQEFNVNVRVGEVNIPLILHLRYNTEGDFWRMDVTDGNSGKMRISNVPLVTGEAPAANLLRQFEYLGLGAAVVVPVTKKTAANIPGFEDLGTDFILVWGSDDEG